MDKNKKLIAIIVILILLVLGFFLFSKKSTKSTETGAPLSGTQKSDDNGMFSGSFMDLINAGKTVTCTYSGTESGMTFEGTTYIAGKKMRTNSSITKVDGTEGKIESYMISDGEWLYTWTAQTNQGMKINITEMEQKAGDSAPSSTPDSNDAAKDFQKDYNYKCENWREDRSMFELPAGIDFVDFSKLMPTVPPTGSGTSSQCAACDYAPDAEAKAECRQALGC